MSDRPQAIRRSMTNAGAASAVPLSVRLPLRDIRAPVRVPSMIVKAFSVVFILGIYYSGLIILLGVNEYSLKPMYLHGVFIVFAAVCYLFPRKSGRLLSPQSQLQYALISYALILTLQIAFYRDFVPILYYDRLIFVFSTLFTLVVFSNLDDTRAVFSALRLIVTFMCALNLAEFIFGFALYTDPYLGRSSGLIDNANAAAVIIGSVVPLLVYGLRPTWKLFYYAVTFVGVFTTFSRSGLILWVVAATLSFLVQPGRKLSARALLAIVTITLAGMVLALNYELVVSAGVEILRPFLNENTASRLLTVNDFSTWERLYVLKLGWAYFLDKPIFGGGVGANLLWGYSKSVHNQILLVLDEQGIFGFCWLAYFVYALFKIKGAYGIWIGALFLVAAPFTHNYFDQPNYGILICLYWLASEQFERDRRARRRLRSRSGAKGAQTAPRSAIAARQADLSIGPIVSDRLLNATPHLAPPLP